MAATHNIVPKSCREALEKIMGNVYPLLGIQSPVFISYCCCNELPHTWHLKTTWVYFLTILEARSVKPRHWQSPASTGSSRKGSFFASFSFRASWCPRLVAASFQPRFPHHHLPRVFSVSTSPSPRVFSSSVSKKTLVIGFGVNQKIQDDLISGSLILSSKTRPFF